jgi:hypothetical protein
MEQSAAPAVVAGGVRDAPIPFGERRIYYVKAATRGSDSAQRGTPRQAIAYITGSRDERREHALSREELEYVARMGPDWGVREAVESIAQAFTLPVPAGSALAYVGRHEDGPKKEIEGGRVPLVGFGVGWRMAR